MYRAKLFLALASAMVLAGGLMCVSHASAETIQIIASADSSLYNAYPNYNAGAFGDWSLRKTTYPGTLRDLRGLLTFDLNVPELNQPGVIITDVKLRVTGTSGSSGTVETTLGVYELLHNYQEGTKTSWSGADPGDVTWNHISYDTVFWSVPGAGGIGTDRSGTLLASMTVIPGFIANRTQYWFVSTSAFKDVVQSKLGGKLNLFAWVENAADENERNCKFWPRVGSDPTNTAESLFIEYEIIPEPSTLMLLAGGLLGLLCYAWRKRR